MRNVGQLLVLGVLAVGYSLVLGLRHQLVGGALLDGGFGVLVGLFVCSRPAANLLDMLLFESRWPASRRRSDLAWVGLNLLVLGFGCIMVMGGATRFASVCV